MSLLRILWFIFLLSIATSQISTTSEGDDSEDENPTTSVGDDDSRDTDTTSEADDSNDHSASTTSADYDSADTDTAINDSDDDILAENDSFSVTDDSDSLEVTDSDDDDSGSFDVTDSDDDSSFDVSNSSDDESHENDSFSATDSDSDDSLDGDSSDKIDDDTDETASSDNTVGSLPPTAGPTLVVNVVGQLPTGNDPTNTEQSINSMFSDNVLSLRPLECGNMTTRTFAASQPMDGLIDIPAGAGYGEFTIDFGTNSGTLYIFVVDEVTGDLTFQSEHEFTGLWSEHFTNTMELKLWVLTADDEVNGEEFSVSMACADNNLEGIFGDVMHELGGEVAIREVSRSEWESNQLQWYHVVGIVMMVLLMFGISVIYWYVKKNGGPSYKAYDMHGGGHRLQML